jgi:EmrB/QacA subfamily drug resistance transporter
MPKTHEHKGMALLLICLVQFMVVLDIAIVNVALPTIKDSLNFGEDSLSWVINAYTLTFGGLLLLGGRAADLLGRRRMFVSGLVLFSLASLVCGLSTSAAMLVSARAVQGVGAAIISPAALSILMTTFQEGPERNKALGIWGAIAGTGGAAGVLLGGILTQELNWSWIFFINVPIGAAVLLAAPRYIRESRVEAAERAFDIGGAILATSGLSLLVYALVQTTDHAWGSARTIGLFIAAVALLISFVATEARAKHPLMPLHIFRNRSLSSANAVALMLGASVFSMFFLLTLYMQQVLGYSPLKTGIGYLTVATTIVVSAGASQAFVTRIGARTVLAFGMALTSIGPSTSRRCRSTARTSAIWCPGSCSPAPASGSRSCRCRSRPWWASRMTRRASRRASSTPASRWAARWALPSSAPWPSRRPRTTSSHTCRPPCRCSCTGRSAASRMRSSSGPELRPWASS